MAKKKKKKNKMPYYIASLTAIFAALSVCLAIYSLPADKTNSVDTEEETNITESENISALSASDAVSSRTMYDGPMLKTDIDNVLLSVHPSGIFTFYENINGKLTECPDTQTMEISAECSHQTLPATLYYLERNGIFTGFGLFTTSIRTEDVRLFDYAFFRVMNMPSGYGDGKHLLMVDFDGKDFGLSDKTYSELFSFDKETGKAAKLTGDNGRTVDKFGRLRSDWAQLNDALIEFSADRLYLSGRNYLLDSTKADLLFIEGNTKTKPTWKSSGIYENYMNCIGDKLYYVKETDEGFEVFSMTTDGTETKTVAFSGSVNDYLFCGDYILNKNNLVLKRISTDENKADLGKFLSVTAYPEFMSVSSDGTKLVILCNTAPQTIIMYDMTTGAEKVITDEKLFTNICQQIIWTSDSSFLTVYQKSGNEYETLLWSF